MLCPAVRGGVDPEARAVLSHGWGQSIGAEQATSVPSTVRKSAGEVDHRDDSGPGWVVLQRDRPTRASDELTHDG